MTGRGRKHKRGERGSIEEGQSDSKRTNMAAVEGETFATEPPTTENHNKEPSLTDLREMLLDIQITVNNILLENKKISEDVKELKSTVNKQQSEIVDFKKQLTKARTQFAATEKELDDAKKRINEQQEEIAELYDLQDRLEQYTRKNSLEFPGIPESAYNSTEEAILKVAEALEVPVNSDDIEISHKLNTRGNKAIIAKFISHKAKTNLYRARTKLKHVKLADLFPDSSYATKVQSTRIFINENLTSYRRRIMSRANEKRRDGELLSAWSMDGTIYVKTSPNGKPIKIIELEDLENL